MLPSILRNALLTVAVLLPAQVLANYDDLDGECVAEAVVAAASIEATLVVTVSSPSTSLTSSSTPLEVLQTTTSTTPTSEVQTSAAIITTTLVPIVVTTTTQITITREEATIQDHPTQAVTSTAEPSTSSGLEVVPVEQTTSASSSVESTMETPTTAGVETSPTSTSTSTPTTSMTSTPLTSTFSSSAEETTPAITMVIPVTTNESKSSAFKTKATKKGAAKAHPTALTEGATTEVISTTGLGSWGLETDSPTATAPSPSDTNGALEMATGSPTVTASSSTDTNSALEMATDSPTATSSFVVSTISSISATGSKTSSSSGSKETTDGVGGGSPFSVVTDSAATPGLKLSRVVPAVTVVMALFALVL